MYKKYKMSKYKKKNVKNIKCSINIKYIIVYS